jgi:hypothetical protein
MRLNERLEPQRYEQRLQEIRKERKAEMRKVERLSALLAKKVSSAKATGLQRGLLSLSVSVQASLRC